MTTGPCVRVVAHGLGFTEGPVIRSDGTIVVTSLTHGRVYSIDGAEVRVLGQVEAAANGAAEGADGQIYVTHFWGAPPAPPTTGSTGGIVAVDTTGAVRWVTRDPVSPNDCCFGPDGALYVTDPTRPRRQDGRIWRCDVTDGTAELLLSVPWHPNGIGFDAEDAHLFVASTHHHEVLVFPYEVGGSLGSPEVFCRLPSGRPDGFAFDAQGNLIVAAPDDPGQQSFLHVFDRDGKVIESYAPLASHRFSNVAVGGDGLVVVTDVEHESVVTVESWAGPGLSLHPFR